MVEKRNLKFVELFAGCGGMSLGLQAAGFTQVFANELSPMAAETYAYNLLPNYVDDMFWLASQYKRGDDQRLTEPPHEAIQGEEKELDDFINKVSNSEPCMLVGDIRSFFSTITNKQKIKFIEAVGDIDILSGGPPCQSYSMAGRREKDNQRNSLFEDFARMAELLTPKIILFENVTGILRPFIGEDDEEHYAWFEIAKRFASIGYVPVCLHINTRYLGIPQNRPRFLLIGFEKRLFKKLNLCKHYPLHWELTEAMSESLNPEKCEAIYDEFLNNGILEYSNGKVPDEDIKYLFSMYGESINSVEYAIDYIKDTTQKYTVGEDDYSKMLCEEYEYVKKETGTPLLNHEARNHGSRVRSRFRLLQLLDRHVKQDVQKKYFKWAKAEKDVNSYLPRDLLSRLENRKLLFIKNKKECEDRKPRNRTEISNLLRQLKSKKHSQVVLKRDLPAPAQLSIPDDMCHYDMAQPRTLTVREMARIQTFPEWFVFKNKPTTGGDRRAFEVPQYTQVGNAVPPLLAKRVGQTLKDILEGQEK